MFLKNLIIILITEKVSEIITITYFEKFENWKF